MPTTANIQQQCFDLITERWPQMPRTWRRLKARQAANRWAADQDQAMLTNDTPLGQEQIAVAIADTHTSS